MANPYTLAITGDLDGYVRLQEEAQKRADTRAIQGAVSTGKAQVRRLIISAGLGQKIANAFRGVSDPRPGKPPQHNPRGVLYSKAIVKRAGGLVDLIEAFRVGVIIRGKLYVPAKGVPRDPRKYGRTTYIVWLKRGRGRPAASGDTLGYVFDSDSRKLLYTIRSAVRVKKRLGRIDGIFDRLDASLEDRRLRALDAELTRIERKSGLTVRMLMNGG